MLQANKPNQRISLFLTAAGVPAKGITVANIDSKSFICRKPDGVVEQVALADGVSWIETDSTRMPGFYDILLPKSILNVPGVDFTVILKPNAVVFPAPFESVFRQFVVSEVQPQLDSLVIACRNLPADPASDTTIKKLELNLQTQIQQSSTAAVTNIKGIAGPSLSELAGPGFDKKSSLTALSAQLASLLKVSTGRWRIDTASAQLFIYELDGVTPYLIFNLLDAAGSPSPTDIFERVPVP